MTLTKLIPNGSRVNAGDLIAVFDSTQQIDQARDAQAKFDDLSHQVDQKRAQNRADSEKRAADLRQAEADLAKAEIELQKGSRPQRHIDRQKDEVKLQIARTHVESLKKSNAEHDKSDTAALRILELQRDRQKVMLERTQNNIAKLELRTPLAGMVAHQNLYRNNSMGHAQEGDQLYRGQPLVSIFDPSEMLVRCAVGEPDGAALTPGTRATVYFDAYPDLALPAHFEFASPVASSAFGSPIKSFTAVFKLDKTAPQLMPELSDAVVLAPLPKSRRGRQMSPRDPVPHASGAVSRLISTRFARALPRSPSRDSRTRIRLRWVSFLLFVAVVGGASAAIYRYRVALPAAVLPSAPARLGDFLVIVRCRGELKAERSVQVYTPMVPNLRISWMTPPGVNVKEGEPIVRFDSSSAEQTLMQKDAALRQAQATLDQALAQSHITTEQDKTDLADAGYTVERARLEASKQEVVSRLQGEESKIDWLRRRPAEREKVEEATVDLHGASDRAKIASLTRQRDQAQADVDITKARIAQMEITLSSPASSSSSPIYSQGWMNAGHPKVGDNVYAGMVLAEMRPTSPPWAHATPSVEEIDQAASPPIEVRVQIIDSLPELTLNAKIRQISLLAEASNEFPPVRSFRAYAAIPRPDPRLRPGMNGGGMDIIINRIPKALVSIPAKALFTHAGKPIVYIAEKGQYRAINVEVLARNPDEIAVKGIPDGAMVTLVDPGKKDAKK